VGHGALPGECRVAWFAVRPGVASCAPCCARHIPAMSRMPRRRGRDNGCSRRPQSGAGATFAAMTAPEIRLTPSTARALRCRAQLLTAAAAAETPVAAARHMLALQAQNANAARWALG